MDLCQTRRGEMQKIEYLSPERVELVYRVPLAEVVIDFFDQMKSRTQGYASLDYEPAGYARADLVKVDILLNSVPVDAFSTIVHRDKADEYGRRMSEKLHGADPARCSTCRSRRPSAGGSSPARRSRRSARTCWPSATAATSRRKRKLLEKQKEGKKRMKNIGRVEVPQEAFIAALRLEDCTRRRGVGLVQVLPAPTASVPEQLGPTDNDASRVDGMTGRRTGASQHQRPLTGAATGSSWRLAARG